MNIPALMRRYKPLMKQFMSYFAVALLGYIVDFGALILLTSVFHVHYLIGATIGFILGLIVTYIMSTKFVFGRSKITSKSAEFSVFALVGLIGLVLLNIFMWLLTDLIGISYILSKVIATIFVYLWNFFARRSFYEVGA